MIHLHRHFFFFLLFGLTCFFIASLDQAFGQKGSGQNAPKFTKEELEEMARDVGGVVIDGRVWLGNYKPNAYMLTEAASKFEYATMSGNGKFVAVCNNTGEVEIWETNGPRRLAVLSGHESPVQCAAFTSNGEYLAVGCEDGNVSIWNVTKRKKLRTFFAGGRGSNKDTVTIQLFGKRNPFLRPPIKNLAITKDGLRFVATQATSYKIWNANNGRELSTPLVDVSFMRTVSFSDDGTRLVAMEFFKPVLHFVKTGELIGKYDIHGTAVCFGPKDTLIVVGTGKERDGILVYDWQKSQILRKFPKLKDAGFVASINNEEFVVVSGDGHVVRWNMNGQKTADFCTNTEHGVSSISLSDDGRKMLISSVSYTILYDMPTGRLVTSFPPLDEKTEKSKK